MQQTTFHPLSGPGAGTPAPVLSDALTDDQLEVVVGGLHRHPLDDPGEGRGVPHYEVPHLDHSRVV
jgi:hypothetical protein